jgi:hypothetical protein
MPWADGSAESPYAALQQWATTWRDSLSEPNYNNIWIWLAVAEGVASIFADDDAGWQDAVSRYKGNNSWNDYNSNGSFQAELNRDNGFRYQIFRMKAHCMFCELARHKGTDLYSYNDLQKSFDWMRPYILDPGTWEHGTGTLDIDRNQEAPEIYELAHSIWEQDDYLDVVNIPGRPVDGNRLLGDAVTMTHGNLPAVGGGGTYSPSSGSPGVGGGGGGSGVFDYLSMSGDCDFVNMPGNSSGGTGDTTNATNPDGGTDDQGFVPQQETITVGSDEPRSFTASARRNSFTWAGGTIP